MRQLAGCVVVLLVPCYLSFAATIRVRAEDPGVPPSATPPSAAALIKSTTTRAPGSLARLPNVSSWRRLDENLNVCDGLIQFKPQVINQKDGPSTVAVADFDGDGDVDVAAVLNFDDKISWYENLNGAGRFSPEPHRITSQLSSPEAIAVADLDGDGDLDVLAASSEDGTIAWYENFNGNFPYSGQHVITRKLLSCRSVAAADLDGDGDLDVVATSASMSTVIWFENLDGAGKFSWKNSVMTSVSPSIMSAIPADLDGDGNLELLLTHYDKIVWYDNLDGAGDFSGTEYIIANVGSVSVATGDIDGDGDLDVLSSGYTLGWYENLDGAGDFSGPQRVIKTLDSAAYLVEMADLDGDSDLDVLAVLYSPGKIIWYENLDGAGDFSGPQRIILNNAIGIKSVATADIDGDANLDVLSASLELDNLAWYENECGPMTAVPTPVPTTSQPTPEPTAAQPTSKPTTSQPTQEPTDQPTYEPTYWGPQLFGKKPQTAGFQRLCVAWCIIFCIISIVVLGFVMHASQHKDMNLVRIILTIVLSQYDYASDTLFIGFQNFVTPTLFVAALTTYLLPLAVFIVVYRRVISVQIARIYASTKAKTVVRFDSWDELPKALTEIGSRALFPLALAASTIVYLMLLFVFNTCKLMSVSFFAVKFFKAGGVDCTQEDFELMFKRNVLSELVFESSGELIIVFVDYGLRHRGLQSNTSLSSWALLSIVGGSLMLAFEAWPYLYQIVWMGRGLEAGIANVSTKLEFRHREVLVTSLMGGSIAYRELSPPVDEPSMKTPGKEKDFPGSSEVNDVKFIDSVE